MANIWVDRGWVRPNKPGTGLRAGGRGKRIDEGQESERKKSMEGECDERVWLTSNPHKHILDDHLCKSPVWPFIGRIGSISTRNTWRLHHTSIPCISDIHTFQKRWAIFVKHKHQAKIMLTEEVPREPHTCTLLNIETNWNENHYHQLPRIPG